MRKWRSTTSRRVESWKNAASRFYVKVRRAPTLPAATSRNTSCDSTRRPADPRMPGYSGTPLRQKLGLKPPLTLWVVGAPAEYESWVAPLDDGVLIARRRPRAPIAAA